MGREGSACQPASPLFSPAPKFPPWSGKGRRRIQNPHRSRVVALPFHIGEVSMEFFGSKNPLGDGIKVGSGCIARDGRSLRDEAGNNLSPHGDCHILPLLDPAHDGGEVLSNISDACSFHCFTEMFHIIEECQVAVRKFSTTRGPVFRRGETISADRSEGVASANDFVRSDELDGAILFVMDCSHSTATPLATRVKEKGTHRVPTLVRFFRFSTQLALNLKMRPKTQLQFFCISAILAL